MDRIDRYTVTPLGKLIGVFCFLLIWGMIALIIAEILSRLILDRSVYGSFDLQVILFTFTMGPAMLYAQLHNRHIRMSLLVSHFNTSVRETIQRITLVVIAIATAVSAWVSFSYTLELFRLKTGYGDAFNTPVWLLYSVPSVTWLLLLVIVVLSLIKKRYLPIVPDR